MGETDSDRIAHLLETPDLADALGSERFKQILDHLPVAIAVSELDPTETIVYANIEFERLIGVAAPELLGSTWGGLPGRSSDDRGLGDAIAGDKDHVGSFDVAVDGTTRRLDAWSNLIQDEDGAEVYRLAALVETPGDDGRAELEQAVQEKDTLLRELQHRVKNNLQMITTLIRVESRNTPDGERVDRDRFARLAGRVESLALLYKSLSDEDRDGPIDLGVYLSQIASAVMQAHAGEGIRLALKVDTWPVSINVAMPTGLVVNELMTNALKHAFSGRRGGTISVESLVDDRGCEVVVADDGIGLPAGAVWPQRGKMGMLMVQSLRQNAKASFDLVSSPESGTRATMLFARTDATVD